MTQSTSTPASRSSDDVMDPTGMLESGAHLRVSHSLGKVDERKIGGAMFRTWCFVAEGGGHVALVLRFERHHWVLRRRVIAIRQPLDDPDGLARTLAECRQLLAGAEGRPDLSVLEESATERFSWRLFGVRIDRRFTRSIWKDVALVDHEKCGWLMDRSALRLSRGAFHAWYGHRGAERMICCQSGIYRGESVVNAPRPTPVCFTFPVVALRRAVDALEATQGTGTP